MPADNALEAAASKGNKTESSIVMSDVLSERPFLRTVDGQEALQLRRRRRGRPGDMTELAVLATQIEMRRLPHPLQGKI